MREFCAFGALFTVTVAIAGCPKSPSPQESPAAESEPSKPMSSESEEPSRGTHNRSPGSAHRPELENDASTPNGQVDASSNRSPDSELQTAQDDIAEAKRLFERSKSRSGPSDYGRAFQEAREAFKLIRENDSSRAQALCSQISMHLEDVTKRLAEENQNSALDDSRPLILK